MVARNLALIFLAVLISVTAQLNLKTGMGQIGRIDNLTLSTLIPTALAMATNLRVIIGITLYGFGTFVWLILLSRLDLSLLYPFGALQYFFIFAASYFLLGEHIGMGRIAGLLLISLGLLVLGKWG